ncbi:helix-turn-helix domain-containing protein [Streptomyces sp. NPDC056399]|uniref:helix-turn-helix domain-containing protein n=1 Tax=Streptomyces sp. NPDC056399 TaxID=3345807 RepID=UPI0035DD13E4
MARPEVPVDFTIPERGELAANLRSLRKAKGITYKQLAENTGGEFSASHYKRAASGKELFGMDVVLSYARGCVGKLTWGQIGELDALHRSADAAVRKIERNKRRSSFPPKPQLVEGPPDLSRAMRDAWARAGRPSMRKISNFAGVYVPHSSAHAIVSGRSVPQDLRQYLYFLEACDITSPDHLEPWLRAWVKAWGIPSDRSVARDLRWMDEETSKVFKEVIVAERAERYDVQQVTHLLDHAIDRTLDSIGDVSHGDKHSAMVSLGHALERVAEVHRYLRKNTGTTYGAIA